jgi:uncharacterized membrane protein (UPF0127 family)
MLGNLLQKTLAYRRIEIGYKEKRLTVLLSENFLQHLYGLSYREGIEEGLSGMLFTFGREGRYSIATENMKFPIDILWLDNIGNVVQLVENAEPRKVFKAEKLAWAALELKAGLAKELGLAVGEKLELMS